MNFWEKLNDAELKIRDNVQSLTRLSGAGRSSSEITSNISGIADQIKEIQDRTRIEHQGGVGDKANTFTGTLARLVRKGRQKLTGDSDEQEQDRLSALRTKAKQDLLDLGKNQEKVNHSTELSIAGREKESELLKEDVRFMQKMHDLAAMEVSVGEFGQTAADRAARRENRINIGEINRQDSEADQRIAGEMRNNQFDLFKQIGGGGEGWQAYQQDQRDQRLANMAFDARRRDYESRRARGAYGQTGPEGEIFGSNSDGEKTIGDLYELTQRVWDKN